MDWHTANDLGHHPMNLKMGGVGVPLVPRGPWPSSTYSNPMSAEARKREREIFFSSISFNLRASKLQEFDAKHVPHCQDCSCGRGWACQERKYFMEQIDKQFDNLSPISGIF